ncbi:MAG: hemolysin III family protein [Acidimicrobiia bacterium]|nr:hemolysin III family protein [Acidimicrobiia bacterium]
MRASVRVRLGKMTHPVRGFLHGSAGVLSLVATALLLAMASTDLSGRLALLVFGLSLVALYTTSSLYHSVPWTKTWKRRMQKLDHLMIHVLTAGTYTPIAVIVFDGWLEVVTLAVQWGVVAIALVHKLVAERMGPGSVALSTTQGWLALLLLWPLAQRLPWTALAVVLLGGVLYTIGMVFLVTNWPRLWPRTFSYHEVFHVLVILASSVHFFFIARWVVGYQA